MALKIAATGVITGKSFLLDSSGVKMNAGAWNNPHVTFPEITCILVSGDNQLSIQAGNDVHSIPFKPNKAEHQEFIRVLTREVHSTVPRSGAAG